MDDSLLNAWWMRWAVLGVGVIVSLVGWMTRDEDHRSAHLEKGLLRDSVRYDDDFQAGWNRFVWILAGAVLIVVGLFWSPLKKYLFALIS